MQYRYLCFFSICVSCRLKLSEAQIEASTSARHAQLGTEVSCLTIVRDNLTARMLPVPGRADIDPCQQYYGQDGTGNLGFYDQHGFCFLSRCVKSNFWRPFPNPEYAPILVRAYVDKAEARS